MSKIGRPRISTEPRQSVGVSIPRSLADWLETKNNKSAVVERALLMLKGHEEENELPLLEWDLENIKQKKAIARNELMNLVDKEDTLERLIVAEKERIGKKHKRLSNIEKEEEEIDRMLNISKQDPRSPVFEGEGGSNESGTDDQGHSSSDSL